MAVDAFNRPIFPGDIVLVSSTSYAQMHIGVLINANKAATVSILSSSGGVFSYERCGTVDRLAKVEDDFVRTLPQAKIEMLKLAQMLIRSGKGTSLRERWRVADLETIRRELAVIQARN